MMHPNVYTYIELFIQQIRWLIKKIITIATVCVLIVAIAAAYAIYNNGSVDDNSDSSNPSQDVTSKGDGTHGIR